MMWFYDVYYHLFKYRADMRGKNRIKIRLYTLDGLGWTYHFWTNLRGDVIFLLVGWWTKGVTLIQQPIGQGWYMVCQNWSLFVQVRIFGCYDVICRSLPWMTPIQHNIFRIVSVLVFSDDRVIQPAMERTQLLETAWLFAGFGMFGGRT